MKHDYELLKSHEETVLLLSDALKRIKNLEKIVDSVKGGFKKCEDCLQR